MKQQSGSSSLQNCSAGFFLTLLVFNFMSIAFSATEAPLCGPGEDANECHSQDSAETPRVAEVRVQNCSQDMERFCFHGTCIFFVELEEHHCRCEKGYTGNRCMHTELVMQPMSEEYVALTVAMTLLFVVAVSVTIYFIHRWYKKRRHEQTEKKYAGLPTSHV